MAIISLKILVDKVVSSQTRDGSMYDYAMLWIRKQICGMIPSDVWYRRFTSALDTLSGMARRSF